MQTKLVIKRGVFRLSAVLLTALGLTACTKGARTSDETAPIRVRTQVVAARTAIVTSRYVGTVEAAHETPVSTQSAGRVLNLYCHEGEQVRQGQVLMRIDSTQAMNALRSAEASLRHAEDGYQRVRQVHEQGVVTDQKMVEIESRLVQAQSMFASAQRQVAECTVVAPCDGKVSGLAVKQNQSVLPGMRLLNILDMSAFSVVFAVPEAEVGDIALGRKGQAECTALGKNYPVRVTEKNISANPVTHTYQLRARLEGNTSDLMAGMVAKVMLYDEQPDILIVPATCILMMPQGATVWVVEQGRAVRRDIAVGGYMADGVRVETGLQSGDTLIVEGYQKLYKGVKVNSYREE